MKKFNAIAVILAMLVIATLACNTENEKSILGKWEYSYWTLGGESVDLKNMGDPTIEFKEGGEYTVKAGFQENNEKWQQNGDTITLLYNDGNNQKLVIEKHTADSLFLTGKTGELDSHLLLVKVK